MCLEGMTPPRSRVFSLWSENPYCFGWFSPPLFILRQYFSFRMVRWLPFRSPVIVPLVAFFFGFFVDRSAPTLEVTFLPRIFFSYLDLDFFVFRDNPQLRIQWVVVLQFFFELGFFSSPRIVGRFLYDSSLSFVFFCLCGPCSLFSAKSCPPPLCPPLVRILPGPPPFPRGERGEFLLPRSATANPDSPAFEPFF